MSNVTTVLGKSLRLLIRQPRLFIPKLLSSLLGSIWFIGVLTGLFSLYTLVLFFVPVSIAGVLASLMVAAMVRDDVGLKNSFLSTLKMWRQVLYTVLTFTFLGFLLSLPVSIGLLTYFTYSNIILLILLVIFALLMLFGVVFTTYFLPITLLEEKSFLKGLGQSFKASKSHSKEVGILTMFSFLLLGLTFASNEYLELLGYAGFVAGRLLSAVVTTYVFVVSPKYYLEI